MSPPNLQKFSYQIGALLRRAVMHHLLTKDCLPFQKQELLGEGSQHPSPDVKTLCNFEAQIWLEIITFA